MKIHFSLDCWKILLMKIKQKTKRIGAFILPQLAADKSARESTSLNYNSPPTSSAAPRCSITQFSRFDRIRLGTESSCLRDERGRLDYRKRGETIALWTEVVLPAVFHWPPAVGACWTSRNSSPGCKSSSSTRTETEQ